MTVKTDTINRLALETLLADAAVQTVNVISHAHGWSVVIHDGLLKKVLVSDDGSVRLFREFEVLEDYLHRVGVAQFRIDAIDVDPHSQDALEKHPTPGMGSTSLPQAKGHDAWFDEQVEQGLAEADDPATEWVRDEDVNALMEEQRARLLKRVKASPA